MPFLRSLLPEIPIYTQELLLAVALVLIAMYVVGRCLIFKKAGRHFGFSFIQGYGTYLLYDLADSKHLFFGILGFANGITIVSALMLLLGSHTLLVILNCLFLFSILILMITMNVRLSQVFGFNGYFALGLIFLGPLFMLLLGILAKDFQGPTAPDAVKKSGVTARF